MEREVRTVAIVPSAGSGRRLKARIKKPFVPLGSKPMAIHALKVLDACDAIDGIIVASEKSSLTKFKTLIKKAGIRKMIAVVAGGRTRFESVRNCLAKVDDSFDIVLIHDAARPLVDKALIRKSIALCKKTGACVVAVRETDTVKLADKDLFIKSTLDRTRIFRAQTPQVFRRDIIRKAYALAPADTVTDDASLVEMLGIRIKILEGSYRNIKITTREDLKIAEALLCG